MREAGVKQIFLSVLFALNVSQICWFFIHLVKKGHREHFEGGGALYQKKI